MALPLRLLRGAALSALPFDVYVDSVAGNDSNSGTSPAQAKATLAAAVALMGTGKRLGLVAGSNWREQITVTWTGGLIGVAGPGASPIINAADVATGWTQPDSVTYPNVWALLWTRGHIPEGTDYLLLWADGVLQTHQSSLANLQANGGWRAADRVAQTTTVYIKSVTNPNTSGVVYEIPKRANCIKAHSNFAGVSSNGTQIVGPIEALRPSQNYGPIAGSNGAQSKLLVRDGELHHLTSESLAVEDVCALGVDPLPGVTTFPLTAYRPTGAGFTPTWKRAFVIGAGNKNTGNGFYAHSSGAAEAVNSEQMYVQDMQAAVSADTSTFTVRGLYAKDCRYGVRADNPATTVTHSIGRFLTLSGANGFVHEDGPTTSANNVRVIENVAIYCAGGSAVNNGIVRLQDKVGSLTVRNCIIFCDDPADAVPLIYRSNGANGAFSLTVEYCVFVRLSGAGVFRTIDMDSTTPTIVSDHNIWIGRTVVDNRVGGINRNTLAVWQGQGYDLNSVNPYTGTNRATVLAAYFQGDPANGDFRLKAGLGTFPDGVSLNLAGPQSHWDWNARAVAAGAPSRWPVPPVTLAEARSYIAAPEAWNFYP